MYVWSWCHHQNGVAESAIHTVTHMACTMMLHQALCWPEAIKQNLWPFTMSYACDLYHAMPSAWIPLNSLFIGTLDRTPVLSNAHCWGCPAYVLDPHLQGTVKIPKLEPRIRHGVFLGFSNMHSSWVGLIINPHTGPISPQFHVIYDDHFETVVNIGDTIPPNWPELVLSNYECIALNKDSFVELGEDWTTPEEVTDGCQQEREHRTRSNVHTAPLDPLPPNPEGEDTPNVPNVSKEPQESQVCQVQENPKAPEPSLPALEPPVSPRTTRSQVESVANHIEHNLHTRGSILYGKTGKSCPNKYPYF